MKSISNKCRICFSTVGSDNEDFDITRLMLEVLLLNKIVGVKKHSVICRNCAELTKKMFLFKRTCVEKELLYELKSDREIIPKIFKTCRFCTIPVEDPISINVISNKPEFLTLKIFMPEVAFNTEEVITCKSCKENLESYFQLIWTYHETEKKINESLQNGRATNKKTPNDIPKLCETNQPIDNKPKNTENPNLYTCNLCDFKTTRRCWYSRHMGRHENGQELTYECPKCTFQTKRKSFFTRHSLTHKDSNVQMHKCDRCPYQSVRKDTLKQHALTHKDFSEVVSYKCQKCPLVTKSKLQIRRHMMVHKDLSEVTTYKCDECEFETRHKSCLKMHGDLHKDISEVRTFKCGYCPYWARKRRYVRIHELRHKDKSDLNAKVGRFKGGRDVKS